MIMVQESLKKLLIKNQDKFFHGLSFVIISLITIHIAVYFNFYKFSNNWIQSESAKTTFIISNFSQEKKIPLNVTERIERFLSENSDELRFTIIDKNLIKSGLGLANFSDTTGLRLPFIFQIETKDQELVDKIYNRVITISENRVTEKYSHKDELYEITSLFNRIKLIIFMMTIVIVTLFSFLVINVVNAALIGNFKFVEMLQIMGASSFELAKNISQSLIKKLIPGAVLSVIFVYLVSTFLMKLFGSNFDFFDSSFFLETNIMTLLVLIIFIVIFLVLLLFFLMSYSFYFFEKRFFDKV